MAAHPYGCVTSGWYDGTDVLRAKEEWLPANSDVPPYQLSWPNQQEEGGTTPTTDHVLIQPAREGEERERESFLDLWVVTPPFLRTEHY